MSSQQMKSSSSKHKVESLNSAIQQLQIWFPKLRCLLLSCDGELLIEHYANGCNEQSLHDLRSATKSFIGALYGIMLDRQEILPPSTAIFACFKDILPRSRANDTLWHGLTPYHLLTMTSGFHWTTGPKLGERYIHAFHRSPSWARFALRLPIQADKLGQFQYRSIDSHLLSMLMTRCTGRTADEYAARFLFDPLQIHRFEWLRSPDGDTAGHIGLMLTGRDMLKFGEVMTHQGSWPMTTNPLSSPVLSESHAAMTRRQTMADTQILPYSWASESMADHTDGCPGFGTYGYQRWNDHLLSQSCSYALGHGGQIICSIPALRMTIAMASDPKVRRWRHPRQYFEQILIPASLQARNTQGESLLMKETSVMERLTT